MASPIFSPFPPRRVFQGALAANEAYQVAATFNLEDGQVFGAVFISLIAGILATRLGTELYK